MVFVEQVDSTESSVTDAAPSAMFAEYLRLIKFSRLGLLCGHQSIPDNFSEIDTYEPTQDVEFSMYQPKKI